MAVSTTKTSSKGQVVIPAEQVGERLAQRLEDVKSGRDTHLQPDASDMERQPPGDDFSRPASRCSISWRCAAIALSTLVMLASGDPARAGSDETAFGWTGTYAGVFAGSGRGDNRIVDVDGFANWGNPGSTVDYDDAGFAGGVLIGKKCEIDGVPPLRVELDGTFGDVSAKTDRLDPSPSGGDETGESELRWIATARAGIEQALGPVTVFATAGLAVARIDNSVTDLDRSVDSSGNPTPWRVDPDDSFRGGSTGVGWVIGAGVEASLSDVWALRLEGSYLDFGRSTHEVNRSGNNRCCGPGTPRRPAFYSVENKFGVVRLAVIYRFGL